MSLQSSHAICAQPAVAGCSLWTVELDALAAQEAQEALGTLTDDELARMKRFRFERDRSRFAAGRAALRFLLGTVLDRDPAALRFSAGAHGKPALADDPRLAFNLSHSGASAIVAIDPARRHHSVGVDLELRREVPDALALAQGCFDAQEQAVLAACDGPDRDEAFLRGWTRKEACLKAGGTGFSSDMIPSTGIDAQARQVRLHDGSRAWLDSLQLAHAVAALAVIDRGMQDDGAPEKAARRAGP